MKRVMIFSALICAFLANAFGGDAAVLRDMGFSSDGAYYIFGQYGKRDKTYSNYADIWTVDIARNDFVKDASSHSNKTSTTSAKKNEESKGSSADTFQALLNKSADTLNTYNISAPRADQTLYVLEDEGKRGSDEIIFTDFEKTIRHGAIKEYHVNLIMEKTGGAKPSSSFAIELSCQDEKTGKIVARQSFGNSAIKRAAVTDYKIIKIVYNEKTRAIVFIIEKTLKDDTGVNIRYMVETGVLSNDF